MRIRDVAAQVAYIQNLMSAVMHENEHFGRIPGCGDKPVLLKAGAEKLCLLYSIETGRRLGAGVGTCSTMETKYRYRLGWRRIALLQNPTDDC